MNQHHDTIGEGHSPALPTHLRDVLSNGLEVKLHLLQHYAEMALLLAQELLDEEVTMLCGARYTREKPLNGRYSRWGTNPGSIRLQDERVPIEIPRVRDMEADIERPLETYQKMKTPVQLDSRLEEAILLGLSQRDYGRVTSAFVDGFGLSQFGDGRSPNQSVAPSRSALGRR